jgi:hypothetical protein
MGAALNAKWDIVNFLLQGGANVTLLDSVCFFLYLVERDFICLPH